MAIVINGTGTIAGVSATGITTAPTNATDSTKLPLSGGTMTGAILLSDGSTSAPSIAFGADTNTGFYRVGSDKIGAVVGGSLKTTLTSTGLGIGISAPSSDLHLYNSSDHTRLSFQCAQNTGQHWQFQSRNNGEFWIRNDTVGDNKLIINSSGNVGIGVTPETGWRSSAVGLDIGDGGAIAGYDGSSGSMQILSNSYWNTSGGSGWKYKNSSYPATLLNCDGEFVFKTAGNGTADNAITWTTAMTIANDGKVGIGITTPQTEMHVVTATTSLVHIGGTANANGNYQGISLGYSEAGNTLYRKVAVVSAGINDSSARQDFHVLVDTASDSGSTQLVDSKFSVSGTTGICQARNGLTFGSDTASANTLDDYEEGTWTPTDASSASMTLQINNANYTKVGRIVHINAYIIVPSNSSSAQFEIGGLPFNVSSGNNYFPSILNHNASAPVGSLMRAHNDSNKIYGLTGANGNVTNANMTGSICIFQLTYRVTS